MVLPVEDEGRVFNSSFRYLTRREPSVSFEAICKLLLAHLFINKMVQEIESMDLICLICRF